MAGGWVGSGRKGARVDGVGRRVGAAKPCTGMSAPMTLSIVATFKSSCPHNQCHPSKLRATASLPTTKQPVCQPPSQPASLTEVKNAGPKGQADTRY